MLPQDHVGVDPFLRVPAASRARAISPPESWAQWSRYTTDSGTRATGGERHAACRRRPRPARPTRAPGGGRRAPGPAASTSADLVDERGPLGHAHRRSEAPEPGHRGGHRGPADGQALVGLDRVEALGERRHHVGDDHHVGVLEVARHPVVGPGSEEVDVAERVEAVTIDAALRASGPTSTTARSGRARGQPSHEVDVEAVVVQRAHVDRHRARRQVRRPRPRRREVVDVDGVGDHHQVRAGSTGRLAASPVRADGDRVALVEQPVLVGPHPAERPGRRRRPRSSRR